MNKAITGALVFVVVGLMVSATATAETVSVEYQQPEGWSLIPNPILVDDADYMQLYSFTDPQYSYSYDRTTGMSLLFRQGELVPSQEDIQNALDAGQITWESNPVVWRYNEQQKDSIEVEINDLEEVDYSLADVRIDAGWNYLLVPPELAREGSKMTEDCRPSKVAFWMASSGPGGEAQSWNVWSPTNDDSLDYNAFVAGEYEGEPDGSINEYLLMRPVLMYFSESCTPEIVNPVDKPTPPDPP